MNKHYYGPCGSRIYPLRELMAISRQLFTARNSGADAVGVVVGHHTVTIYRDGRALVDGPSPAEIKEYLDREGYSVV